ncbi:hypothetical protein PVAP13_7KG277900 [Panicum virgatum]|uniref:Uncharacterized protein n=1 Tax=Panicum virgatum TaxID=38727 RepID=A0A8T0QP04_PANVG|nr:hypothetical protein PVAP13_7KG277900 [Panicum virgatum]
MSWLKLIRPRRQWKTLVVKPLVQSQRLPVRDLVTSAKVCFTVTSLLLETKKLYKEECCLRKRYRCLVRGEPVTEASNLRPAEYRVAEKGVQLNNRSSRSQGCGLRLFPTLLEKV